LCKACQEQAARIYHETFRLSRIDQRGIVSIINNQQNFVNTGNWVKTLIVDETSTLLQKKTLPQASQVFSKPIKDRDHWYLQIPKRRIQSIDKLLGELVRH
jgi:hypothetical protein